VKYFRCLNAASRSAKWKIQLNNQVHLVAEKRLSKKTTSRNILIATPDCVIGAGGVGIFRGAGIVEYSYILYASPINNIAAAK
jgi:hypothetical protein